MSDLFSCIHELGHLQNGLSVCPYVQKVKFRSAIILKKCLKIIAGNGLAVAAVPVLKLHQM